MLTKFTFSPSSFIKFEEFRSQFASFIAFSILVQRPHPSAELSVFGPNWKLFPGSLPAPTPFSPLSWCPCATRTRPSGALASQIYLLCPSKAVFRFAHPRQRVFPLLHHCSGKIGQGFTTESNNFTCTVSKAVGDTFPPFLFTALCSICAFSLASVLII